MKSFNLRKWLHERSHYVEFDEEVLAHSPIARIGNALCQASTVVHALTPVLILIGIIIVTAIPALAQSPRGSIFGGSDQTVGNGVREFVKWGRNLLFLLGVIFVIWAIINYAVEKGWMKQFIGAVGCFGFGGVASLAYSFSQGQAVNLDTSLGN